MYFCSFTVQCDEPAPPMNGRLVSVSERTEGSQITFMCNDGFLPAGVRMATCRADKTWDNDPAMFECEPPATTSKC